MVQYLTIKREKKQPPKKEQLLTDNKKVPQIKVLFIDFRVSNGTRTHDQRNHNPLL